MKTSRRNFLGKLLLGGASFSILPGAGRIRKASGDPEPFCVRVAFGPGKVVDICYYHGSSLPHLPRIQKWEEEALRLTELRLAGYEVHRHYRKLIHEPLAQTPSTPG